MNLNLTVVLVHRDAYERGQLRSAFLALPGVQIAGERSDLRFKGFARAGWIGDYMDPYTFLELFAVPSPGSNNDTGWFDPTYVEMLDAANRTRDPQARYDLLAKAEAFMLETQPIIPLLTRSTDWMKKPYVKGMYPNPGTQHAWKYVYIEHDPANWDVDPS